MGLDGGELFTVVVPEGNSQKIKQKFGYVTLLGVHTIYH